MNKFRFPAFFVAIVMFWSFVAVPVFVFAGELPADENRTPPAMPDVNSITTLSGLLERAVGVLNDVVPFIIGLAVLVVLWGIFNYITQAGEAEKREEAKKFILYGIIGIFCMVSLWGFVGILVNTFSISKTIDTGDIPRVPKIGS